MKSFALLFPVCTMRYRLLRKTALNRFSNKLPVIYESGDQKETRPIGPDAV